MLLPIGHENMSARRLPIITLALIAINLVAFLLTGTAVQQEAPELSTLREHILRLVIFHPELTQPPEAQQLVAYMEKTNPKRWEYAKEANLNLPVLDAWDASIRMARSTEGMQEEMDSLCTQYAALAKSAVSQSYAFIPAHPTALSYVTANFLHGGWLHLIGNMWFLWLAGGILEDTWGRIVYPAFYLIAGMLALQ